MKEKKDIEVVSGDGSNLNISPVYEHLDVETPKSSDEKPKNIVIPKVLTKKAKNDNSEKDKKNNEESKKNKEN